MTNGKPEYARVHATTDLAATLDDLGVACQRPVLVSVGGADGMASEEVDRMAVLVRDQVVPAADRWGAAVVDGGTDSGVMRVLGQERRRAHASFPLIGVAAEGTVVAPGTGEAQLDPDHTHVLLVPGGEWGDESRWLASVASVIADGSPSLTLVVNGGDLTYDDIAHSLDHGRPVVVVAGSGRSADAIAQAARGRTGDQRAVAVARSPLVRVVDVDDGTGLGAVLDQVLGGAAPA